MKLQCSKQRNQALTMVEAVVVVFIIGLFLALIFPTLAPIKKRSSKIGCINNLKQVGLAYRIWAGDNRDQYPMQVSVTNGGTMELIDTSDAWRTFQVMSNELSTPKILACPAAINYDQAAARFDESLKDKISYFIGADAKLEMPNALLSGDDNFLLNKTPVNHGLENITIYGAIEWDSSRHVSTAKKLLIIKTKTGYGHIGLGDGSVQSVTTSALTNLLHQTGLATNRLAIP